MSLATAAGMATAEAGCHLVCGHLQKMVCLSCSPSTIDAILACRQLVAY